jgi:hypothetical protein
VPSAACVVGELLDRGPNLRLVFLGVSAPALPLGPRLDAADVVNALADRGYVALRIDAVDARPAAVRSGVTRTLESHRMQRGAPVDLPVRVTCGGRDESSTTFSRTPPWTPRFARSARG